MNHIRISLIASAFFMATVFFAGCSGPQTVTKQSDTRYIIIQYSGGQEIGRWNLNRMPLYLEGGGWSFWTGDTDLMLNGDIRVLSLPIP